MDNTTMKSRAIPFAALALLALFGLRASADDGATGAQATTVYIKDFMFTPVTLTVPAGSTVTWQNLDEEPHTIRSVDEQVKTGALDQNERYSFTFDRPGTYKYVCSIHPSMVGTIVVKAG
jgi:plastocyanin